MDVVQGKHSFRLDDAAFTARVAGFSAILIDIGTGDGRFVRHIAQSDPRCFAAGVDACRENLNSAARRAPSNALFVIANAYALPGELHGLAARITINFPWGSLLDGLVRGAPALLDGLSSIARPGAVLEVRLNGGALAEAGWGLEVGAARVRQALRDAGFAGEPVVGMDAAALRTFPTSWVKRLAFGRDPRALYLRSAYGVVNEEHAHQGLGALAG